MKVRFVNRSYEMNKWSQFFTHEMEMDKEVELILSDACISKHPVEIIKHFYNGESTTLISRDYKVEEVQFDGAGPTWNGKSLTVYLVEV